MRNITILGAGLLIGTALAVIIKMLLKVSEEYLSNKLITLR